MVLNIDFLQLHGLVLDFTSDQVAVHKSEKSWEVPNDTPHLLEQFQSILEAEKKIRSQACTI